MNLNSQVVHVLNRYIRGTKGLYYRITKKPFPKNREQLVVLGTGWGAYHLCKEIDPSKYQVTVISPRPFFVFTPLLTSTLSGVLSFRAILDPITNVICWGGRPAINFIEGSAKAIEANAKSVTCVTKGGQEITIPYDKLVVAVGSVTNTFDIPGAKEHSLFLKEIEDAQRIRKLLLNNFANANVPGVTEEEKQKLLSLVIVGGGPAGTEAAGELNDFVKNSLVHQYPHLVKKFKITIVEMLPKLLPVFDEKVSKFAEETLTKLGVKLLLNHRVVKVDDNIVHATSRDNTVTKLNYTGLIWASGIGQRALCINLMKQIPEQKGSRLLKVNPNLKVLGDENIFAIGDCAFVTPPKLSDNAETLYYAACKSPYGASATWLERNKKKLIKNNYVQVHEKYWDSKEVANDRFDSFEKFKSFLEDIDNKYKPPVPTGQMARQAGNYLGLHLNRRVNNCIIQWPYRPFIPTNYGAMSYIGGGNAAIQFLTNQNTPNPKKFLKMGGISSVLIRRGYYWLNQNNHYNRMLSLLDMSHACLKGGHSTETF